MSRLTLQAGSSNSPELTLEALGGQLIVRHSKFPDKPFVFKVPKDIGDGLSAIPLARRTGKGLVQGPTVRIWPVMESDVIQISLVGVPGYGDLTWFVLRSEFKAALSENAIRTPMEPVSTSQFEDRIDGVEE